MRSRNEYDEVIKLYQEGKNKSEISRITSIPRSTIRDWLDGSLKKSRDQESIKEVLTRHENLRSDYSYILGLYLGDGYINKTARTERIRITLDKKYSQMNEYAQKRLSNLFSENKVGIIDRKGCVDLSVYNSQISELFPQHGKGKKHTRDVSLEDWQYAIIDHRLLLQGLYHSDGCFFTGHQNKYEIERYTFTNKSKDISDLFSELCVEFGVNCRVYFKKKTECYQVVVARKKDVARLKELIGTKTNIPVVELVDTPLDQGAWE